MDRIPRPEPDPENPGHYKNVFQTLGINGEQRQVYDFLPRANLKKLFAEGNISSDSHLEIEKFCEEFAVEKCCRLCKTLRAIEVQKRKEKRKQRPRE